MSSSCWILGPLFAVLVAVPSAADPPLWVAALGNDGSLHPLARHDGQVWTKVWPEPFSAGAVARVGEDGILRPWVNTHPWPHHPWSLPFVDPSADSLRIDMPLRWHVYAGQVAGTDLVRTTHLVLARAYCDNNWMLKTDWTERERIRPRETPTIVGTGLSQQLPGAGEAYRGRIDAALAKLGFVDPPEGTRGPRHRQLGWFLRGERILGVVYAKYSEAGRYRIVEIDGEDARVVVEAFGGGC